jgi:hypothetical protein
MHGYLSMTESLFYFPFSDHPRGDWHDEVKGVNQGRLPKERSPFGVCCTIRSRHSPQYSISKCSAIFIKPELNKDFNDKEYDPGTESFQRMQVPCIKT